MGGGSLQNVELGMLLTATTAKLPPRLLPNPALAPTVFPLVFDVEGLPPAAYRYVPERHEVLRVRSIERNAVRDSLLLQKDHGEAAAILFLVVPMARWLHDFGDRGYRGAALQVGYLIDRLYLTAESMRLTYTASGGFTPVLADELLDVDGYQRTTMFSFVVGSERKQGSVGSSNGG
jgi:SagB-type dehydrogenase family enzyme